jgi:hypothetical protein
MNYLCPSCQRVLYNRRLTHCGFCGAPIPEALRFTPAELAALNREMAELDRARKARAQAAEKKEKEKRKDTSGGPGFDFTGFM